MFFRGEDMNSRTFKKLALVWIILFFGSAVYFYSTQNQIELHSLKDILIFGYDAFGRNCLKLTLTSAIESLKLVFPLGLICILSSLLTGTLLVIENPWLTSTLRITLDTLNALPGFLISIALSVFFPQSFGVLLLASLFVVYPYLARFFEGQILKIKSEAYLQASFALGGSPLHLFLSHFLPELILSIISIFPFLFTRILILETSLSFLGIGIAPEHETWGKLLYQGKDYLLEAPWILMTSSIPLFLTLFSFHLLSRRDQN